MHDIRWEHDTRLVDACMCATEKPVFNRAAIVYARYVRRCIITPLKSRVSPRAFAPNFSKEKGEESGSGGFRSNAEILSLDFLFLW